MTTKELKQIAKDLKVKNWWNLKKEELVAAIEAAQNEPECIQDEPELIEESEPDKLSVETESPSEPIQGPSNGWEAIAKENIKNAYDWLTGENESAVTDGDMTQEEFDEWIKTEAIDYIYHEAITTKYYYDACGGPAPTEMRFAGKQFCIDYITKLLEKDGYLNAPELPHDAPYGHDDRESNNLSAEKERPTEQSQDASNLKQYAAWVKDRETKELTKVFGEANSREEFYNSIKDKYRVRLITKPEKIDDECEQWKIRHARNLIMKQEKYAADKAKAMEMNMTVAEYRKMVKANK